MKKLSLFYILPALLLVLLFGACDHDTDTIDGPSLVDRFGEFNVLEDLSVSRNTVDFSAGETVFFTARFNKQVNWEIEITGMESGSIKRIDGFSNEVNAGNATWGGGTTELPLFKEELCTVELVITDEGLSFSDDVEVVGAKVYEGNLATDFEENLGGDLVIGNFEFELTNKSGRNNEIPSAQGDWILYLEGTDNVLPNFFCGLVVLNGSVSGDSYFSVPTTVPEDLYFNFFLYADGGPHGIAVIEFIFDANDSGAFEDGQDQVFKAVENYPLGFTGWRHINHPMSDTGLTQEQISKIVAIRFILISDMNSQPNPPLPVDFGVDFVTFTQGAPLRL